MGWGDELMAAGEARKVHERTGRVVAITDYFGNMRKHDAWKNNPYIATYDVQDMERIHVSKKNRGYHKGGDTERWYFVDYEPTPAELFFDEEELTWVDKAKGYWVVEPHIKDAASPNKQWPKSHWEGFARLAQHQRIQLVQLGNEQPELLEGVAWIQTPTMRHAAAVLSGSSGYVGHEGGLHHTAAAVGVPAVVIMGGFVGPNHTGYKLDNHVYLHNGDPCGKRVPCDHCEAAMKQIEPAHVVKAMKNLMAKDV